MKSNLLNTVRAAGRGKRRGGQRAGARTKTTTLCGDYGEPMADPTPPLADSALREQVSFQRLHAHACCRVDTRAPCHAGRACCWHPTCNQKRPSKLSATAKDVHLWASRAAMESGPNLNCLESLTKCRQRERGSPNLKIQDPVSRVGHRVGRVRLRVRLCVWTGIYSVSWLSDTK